MFMKNSVPFKLLEKQECQICLIDLGDHVASLHCGHVFHSHCIIEWLDHQAKLGRNKTCPSCRTEVEKSIEQTSEPCCFGFCFGYRKRKK